MLGSELHEESAAAGWAVVIQIGNLKCGIDEIRTQWNLVWRWIKARWAQD
jgi:hypothetical protein